MDVASVMKGPRLKVERANSHIDRIIADSSPLSRDLYDISIIGERSHALLREPDIGDLSYRPKKPIPEHFALIMGDAIHNLRSSFDHWATAFVDSITKGSGKRAFPFAEDGENFKTHSAYKTIQKTSPDTANFIWNTIQPYGDGNGRPLWVISQLNNIDKHDLIIPTVTIARISGINARIGNGGIVLRDNATRGNASYPIGLIHSNLPITIDKDFKTSVEISFPKGAKFFENEPVIPTLLNLSKAATKAFDALEEFIGRTA